MLKPIAKVEPMPPGVPALIVSGIGPMQAIVLGLGKMDCRYQGCLQGGGKCVWLKDGRRVEIELVPGGGHVASVSDKPDPAYPGKERP